MKKFDTLPNIQTFMRWDWEQIAPFYSALEESSLTQDSAEDWLANWSDVASLMMERFSRLRLQRNLNTADKEAEDAFFDFLENVQTPSRQAEQKLKEKLLTSGLQPNGMTLAIKKMQADHDIYCEENLDLMNEEQKLTAVYDKLFGAQTVMWEGEEMTLTGLKKLFNTPNRAIREQIWRLSSERRLQDREAINENWVKLLTLRLKMSENAGFADYRSYRWQLLKRFDYTPDDCKQFHEAIAQEVVPMASDIYARLRESMGIDVMRPWDVQADVYPLSFPPLKPFEGIEELETVSGNIFNKVDPQLGQYFETMRQENLMNLPNTKGKSPGAYCTGFPASKRPFVFMNAVGTAGDVKTMLHELGHAFHGFEAMANLPYLQQRFSGAEFAEVASMAMELLASPYLTKDEGGFYVSEEEAARHRLNHLAKIVSFWPYMAVVDNFQHWVYENPKAAMNPDNCDQTWGELWDKFIPSIDFTGFEDVKVTGWHRKLHIHRYPFYYVEYGMAQVGAIHVWRNSLQDQAKAIQQYRSALALGGTCSLPELYQAAGSRFQFDNSAMRDVVTLLSDTMHTLS